jgi:hypothetical protein
VRLNQNHIMIDHDLAGRMADTGSANCFRLYDAELMQEMLHDSLTASGAPCRLVTPAMPHWKAIVGLVAELNDDAAQAKREAIYERAANQLG